MISRKTTLDSVIALLLFIPTLWFASHHWVVPGLLITLAFYRTYHHQHDSLIWITVTLMATNSVVGMILNAPPLDLLSSNGLLGSGLLLLVLYASRMLNERVLMIFTGFVLTEFMVILLQMPEGVRFWFDGQLPGYPNISGDDYLRIKHITRYRVLYFIRPFGLSFGATAFPLKALFALMISYTLSIERATKVCLMAILTLAIALTFKRSIILATAIFYLCLYLEDIWQHGWQTRHTTILFCVCSAILLSYQEMWFQLTLGRKMPPTLPTKGPEHPTASSNLIQHFVDNRHSLWQHTWAFIQHHWLLGNHSMRYHLPSGQLPTNTFLTMLATHGLIISVFLVGYLGLLIRQCHVKWLLLAPMFIAAVYDDLFVWYISVYDCLLLALLVATPHTGQDANVNKPLSTAH